MKQMKPLKSTFNLIRKNKLRIAACIVLEFVFIILLIVFLKNYEQATRESNLQLRGVLNDLALDEAPFTGKTTLNSLVAKSDDIPLIEKDLEAAFFKLILSIVIAYNIIYALFFSLIFKIKPGSFGKFIGRFIILNTIVPVVLYFLFERFVDFKESINQNQIIADKSILSSILFLLFAFFVYYIVFVFIVELRKNESLGKMVKNVHKVLKKKFWQLLVIYIMLSIMLVVIFSAAFISMVGFIYSLAAFFISLIIGILILIPFMTISKIYFIECVKRI